MTFATIDHGVTTADRRVGTSDIVVNLLKVLREETAASAIRLFDLEQSGQGIVHVIGPEQRLSLPGSLTVCGDRHTCTQGGIGALAFGIGATELTHVLATQTLVQRLPKTMRVTFNGKARPGVTPKDLILYLIGAIGTAGGTGYAVEYAGDSIRGIGVEGRLTICNLSIESEPRWASSRPMR
ncbi:aconitase family protein [Acidisphaera sp. L21]|uniref:aconitase family protein n=1 Tax=Acidisphaera sp. L21 TaxID=1641851 RepID=UPI0020B10729|nr:aconitase family protein [Acidisphaera sp. L21]